MIATVDVTPLVSNSSSPSQLQESAFAPIWNAMTREVGTGEWETKIMYCSSHKQAGICCCFQYCACHPCSWASTVSQSGLTQVCGKSMTPNELYNVACFVTLCTSYCGGPCCFLAGIRGETAKQNNIKETPMASVLLSCCCFPCALCQVQNEIMVKKGLLFKCGGVESSDLLPPLAPLATATCTTCKSDQGEFQ